MVFVCHFENDIRHNLSPRGDGNKGRKCHCVHFKDTTYPREGTETFFAGISHCYHFGHNLSPRGDGNLKVTEPRWTRPADTTYPREGTETLLDKLPSEGTTTQLIPARGRKL